ncbi:hypothetical protein P4200_15735 [Pseudomonas aeruginosa]|nr:hypothetical protein [Pseudomonas aeruginosa]
MRVTHDRDPLIPDLPYQVLIADIRVRSQHDLLIGMTLKYEIGSSLRSLLRLLVAATWQRAEVLQG